MYQDTLIGTIFAQQRQSIDELDIGVPNMINEEGIQLSSIILDSSQQKWCQCDENLIENGITQKL